MAKPIRLTEDIIAKMAAEFAESIRKCNLSDGKVSYSKSFTYKDVEEKVSILFQPSAFAKMVMLLQGFSTEVAWYGIVERVDNTTFVITDILVYPQTVTGATVNTDQEAHDKWFVNVAKTYGDEVLDKMLMQSHSHVSMSTSPSNVDLSHQEEIVSQLSKDKFFIFMIWNKRMEHTCWVYDMKTNTMYENSDIAVGIVGDDVDLDGFLSEAKKMVTTKYASAYSAPNAYGGTTTYEGSPYTGKNYGSRAKGSAKKSKSDVVSMFDEDDLMDYGVSPYSR